MSDEQKPAKRWFKTGYLANGIGSVSPEQHALNDAAVIRPGEARGHDLWIDQEFCAQVVTAAGKTGDKGIKARFGHPDMCSDALGTFLGRWKNLSMGADGIVKGTLFLSSTASESPKGDLRKYVEEMAAKEPDHFGCSIVFERDFSTESAFMDANQITEVFKNENGQEITSKRFQSPDPANVKNLPHARCLELHAADLVDDPAATDGMFAGIGGAALASQVSEFLDTHPEVLRAMASEPQMIDILSRYSNELRPFIDRYTANRKETQMNAETPEATAEPTATEPEAKPDVLPEADKPKAEEKPAENPAEPVVEASKPNADIEALKAENDRIKTELMQAHDVADKALKAKQEAEQKLKVLERGETPLSSTPAPTSTSTGSCWEKARLSAKK